MDRTTKGDCQMNDDMTDKQREFSFMFKTIIELDKMLKVVFCDGAFLFNPDYSKEVSNAYLNEYLIANISRTVISAYSVIVYDDAISSGVMNMMINNLSEYSNAIRFQSIGSPKALIPSQTSIYSMLNIICDKLKNLCISDSSETNPDDIKVTRISISILDLLSSLIIGGIYSAQMEANRSPYINIFKEILEFNCSLKALLKTSHPIKR